MEQCSALGDAAMQKMKQKVENVSRNQRSEGAGVSGEAGRL